LKGEFGEGEMSAFLMSVFLRGMDREETYHLTMAMAYSGEILDLSQIEGIKVDKHSTGGVGDKVTLIFAPLVASAGLIVPKLSGRALGHTGGTIDKLEAIPGFRASLSKEEFLSQLKRIGLAVSAQTEELAPADKYIYSLRNRIACVESLPLIVSSIMSKKIAGGADVIIIDVKSGRGAFMSGEEARRLAEVLVAIGEMAGKKVSAEITPMDQPLGYAVGRALEVKEAIEVLKGNGPEDVREVCLSLSGLAFWRAGISSSREEGKRKAEELLESGKALEKFAQWMEAQGANPRIIDDFSLLPSADSKPLFADKRGIVKGIDCKRVGEISHILDVHPGGGIVLGRKVGDEVKEGEELALLYGEEPNLSKAWEEMKGVFLIE
jgi:pyrimidine-nucleoside phosphorylase